MPLRSVRAATFLLTLSADRDIDLATSMALDTSLASLKMRLDFLRPGVPCSFRSHHPSEYQYETS
jgi:hypothetical protein